MSGYFHVIVMKDSFKLTIEWYLQYVQNWNLAIEKNEFEKYIFTFFFKKYLGTKYRVIM